MPYDYSFINKKRKKYYEDIPNKDTILFEDYIPDSENIKYNSYFFRSDKIIEYVEEINKIYKKSGKKSLFNQNYKLYNMDDIIHHLLNKPGVHTRNYNKIIQSEKWKKTRKYIIALIASILGKMCDETVNKAYTKASFNRNIKKILSKEEGSRIYDDDIVIMAPVEIEHYISYKKIVETKKARNDIDSDSDSDSDIDSDSDSDSDEEDYILKRIQNIEEEELNEDIEEELNEDMEEELDEDIEEEINENNIIEMINDFEELNFASYEEQFKEKLKMIVGFVIVSRGKCKMFPNDYILNLICTNMSGVGSLLIGLYLFTILKHPIVPMTGENLLMTENLNLTGNGIVYYDKIKKSIDFKKKYKSESKYGIYTFKRQFMTTDDLIPTNGLAILELANSYYNYPGLCLYQKIGFEYDKSLFSKNTDTFCIYDYGNLPMSINFSDDDVNGCYSGLSIDDKINKILNIIVGNEQCPRNQICFIQDDNYKKLLSALNELIVYQDSYMLFNNTTNDSIIIDKKIQKYNRILSIINDNKLENETNYNYIKRIINDIERNNISPNIQILLNVLIGGKKKYNIIKNFTKTKKNKLLRKVQKKMNCKNKTKKIKTKIKTKTKMNCKNKTKTKKIKNKK
jgi:hypothetical protein